MNVGFEQGIDTRVIEALIERALRDTENQRNRYPKRNPTWAPTIGFSVELIDALEASYGKAGSFKFGRLCSLWDNPLTIWTFHLRAGLSQGGRLVLRIAKNINEPKWRAKEGPGGELLCKLGVAEIMRFGENPDQVMLNGARISQTCCICGKPLIDPVSLARGVGRDCYLRMIERGFNPFET